MPAKVFLKVSPDSVMLSLGLFVYRRRKTANPVPAKVFLQVSLDTAIDMAMHFFSTHLCIGGDKLPSQGLSKGES